MKETVNPYVLLWALIALIAYIYLVYPALLWLFGRWRRGKPSPAGPPFDGTVSLIVAAHNEETTIAAKLENCLALDFPRDRLEIIVVSDGSTDRTVEAARRYAGDNVRVIALPRNEGKAAAQNLGVACSRGELLVFTDADVLLERSCLRRLADRFGDPDVGCVTGRVTYSNTTHTGVFEGESAYWRYELLVRKWESALGILTSGSGALIAIRRPFFTRLDSAVSEDFVLPMQAAIAGRRTVYAPDIVATTVLGQDTPVDMFRTRVRTIGLDTRGVYLCRALLNPFRYPGHAWSLISHKVLRWMVPCFLGLALLANVLVASEPVYLAMLALQALFYLAAAAGCLWAPGSKPPRPIGIPFSFCLINGAALVALIRFAMGRQNPAWAPVRRP